MNLTCTICADLITPTEHVNVTSCGHMFHVHCLNEWLKRSLTCPQCRNKCSLRNVFRIYFNVSLNDSFKGDATSLHCKIDSLTLTVAEKDKLLNKLSKDCIELSEKHDKVKNQQKMSAKIIKGLEVKVEQRDLLLKNMQERIDQFQLEQKRYIQIEKDLQAKTDTISSMENVQKILKSSVKEVEEMLATGRSNREMATMIVLLKREMKAMEIKKLEERQAMRQDQQKYQKIKTSYMQLQEKCSNLESDLHKMTTDISSNNCEKQTIIAPASSIALNTHVQEQPSLAPIISDPNYLNIKSSSVGLSPLMMPRRVKKLSQLKRIDSAPPALSSQYEFSIFKKPRLTALSRVENSALCYNGMGGSERKENFLPISRK